MRHRYEELKIALKKHGFIIDRNDPATLLEKSTAWQFNKRNSVAAKWAITKAVEAIDEQAGEITDTKKYFLLLIECQKICVEFSRKRNSDPSLNARNLDEHGALRDLKKVLGYPDDSKFVGRLAKDAIETPTTEDDILFAQLYLMGKVAFGEQTVTPIIQGVVTSETSSKDANAKILQLAYRSFLEATNNEDKQGFLDIIIAHRRVCCDPTHLSAARQVEVGYLLGTLGVNNEILSLEDVIWYQAHTAVEIEDQNRLHYQGLLDSLTTLSKYTSFFFSNSMRTALHGLVVHSNELYQDDNTRVQLKNDCKELLGLLATFSKTIEDYKMAENARKYPALFLEERPLLQASIDTVAQDTPSAKELQKSIAAQVTAITQKIESFSEDAGKNPHWGKIIGWTLVTLGLALLVIIPSLTCGGTFFRREHPIAVQARQLISEGQTVVQAAVQESDHAEELSTIGALPTLEEF